MLVNKKKWRKFFNSIKYWASAKRDLSSNAFYYFILIVVFISVAICFLGLSNKFHGLVLLIVSFFLILCVIGFFAFLRAIIDIVIPSQSREATLRKQFIDNYVSKEYESEPVYETLCKVIKLDTDPKAQRLLLALYCAKENGWILGIPSFKEACSYWGEYVTLSPSNYSEQLSNVGKNEFPEKQKVNIIWMNGLLAKQMNKLKK
jgi:diacylglycerol kinase